MNNIFFNRIINLNRLTKQLILILIDTFLIIFILLSSFSIRLGYWYWPKDELLLIIFLAPIFAIPIFMSFKLYRSVLRYIGVKAFSAIIQGVTLYAVIWGLIGYMAMIEGIPRSVILINWMLALILICGFRVGARWGLNFYSNSYNSKKINVIIYGAGSAGRMLSNVLQLSEQYNQIAYIDDILAKDRTYINNIPVFAYDNIQALIEENDVNEILLALPSMSRKNKYEVIKKLSSLSVHVRSLPSLSEIAEGKVKIDDLLEIDLSDVLGRDVVKPNINLLKTNITNKIVLVTGAGGSIGSELCRQIVQLKPKILILFDLSESSLFKIEQEILQLKVSVCKIYAVLGSVRDKLRVESIFEQFGIQTIYHAAAYKHVPLVEFNQSEGVLNNIIGTQIIAEAAIRFNVEVFILISTDKAVRPTNTMGATKRVCELILQALSKNSHNTCFTMVRFGNVLDSSGSVIPTFKKQIKDGGPITVTDKKIERYFMIIPEAVELVIQAGAMAKGGEVYVLDMGKPVLINDLAIKMIQLSGLKVLDENNPDGDIEIKYIGLRPGEKMYEELLVEGNIDKTDHKLIMSATENMIDWDELMVILKQIQDAALNSNRVKIRELLVELVPEFKPQQSDRFRF